MSVGGGEGGSAANLNVNPLPKSWVGSGDGSNLNATIDVDIGGSGGAAGDGGVVSVTNAAALATAGASSKGIYVSSGGGDGGTASSASLSFNGVCAAISGGYNYLCAAKPDPDNPQLKSTTISVTLSAEVGGASGDGKGVTVTNQGPITTTGNRGHGIAVHSIGSGGGNSGEGAMGIAAWTNNKTARWIANLPCTFTFIPNWGNVSIAVGGSAGAAGDGGTVQVTGTGSIATAGKHALGVRAQSIGGGGGNGGAGASGLWGALALGGRGSGGRPGGPVTVSHSATVTTTGEGGMAIFAQSVGGGGGTAGDAQKGWTAPWANLNIGVGVAAQQSAGSGGDGGAVSVTAGAISTAGDSAHGIAAQSVGSSGGSAAISGLVGGQGLDSFAGSVGDAGDGGAVSVTANGPITLVGPNAHGIFAQSVGGQKCNPDDTAGDVTITVNAGIAATGTGARAILAQRASGTAGTNGAIAITVAEAMKVETSASGAETIGIKSGPVSTLTNDGVIRNPGTAADDNVIRTDGAATLAIGNTGVIEGSILSEGADGTGASISVDNSAVGGFFLGAAIGLGGAGSFASAGLVSAGAAGAIGTSSLAGDFSQASTGTLLVDFGFGGGMELIAVSGSGQPALAGMVDPEPQGALPKTGAKGGGPIVSADAGLASSGHAVANTAAVTYALATDGGDIASVFSPLMAAIATQSSGKRSTGSFSDSPHTLNAGPWFRRGRFVMVAPRFSAIFLPISSGSTTQRTCSDFPSHLSL